MQINENAQTTSSYVQNPFLHTYLALKSIEETKFEVLNPSQQDICFPIKIHLHIYLDILFLCFHIHAQNLNTL